MVTQALGEIGLRLWYETGANLSQSFDLSGNVLCSISAFQYFLLFCLSEFVIKLQIILRSQ